MKKTIGKVLISLSKTKLFKNLVIELLAKHPKLMDCVDLATEIYKDVKEITEPTSSN